MGILKRRVVEVRSWGVLEGAAQTPVSSYVRLACCDMSRLALSLTRVMCVHRLKNRGVNRLYHPNHEPNYTHPSYKLTLQLFLTATES